MKDNQAKYPQLRFNGFTDPWEQRKTKELCDISTGKGNTQDKVEDGKYPFYVRSATIERSNEYLYDQEAVLTVGDGVGTGKVFHYVNGKYNLHQRVYRMFNFNHGVSAKYFYHYFSKNFYRRVMSMTAKTSVDSVRMEMIADMKIKFPSPAEQETIVSVLDGVDDLISLHQRKLAKLKKLKQGYLQKLFPKNGSKFPQLRFAGFADAWEQRKLSEISTMNARIGWQNLRTSEFLDSGDYMLITGTDFKDGKINYSSIHYVEKERYDQDKKIQIKNESILITKDGTLGKVAYVKGLTMPATLNAGVFNVRVRESNLVDSQYLFHYLKAPFLLKYASAQSTGGTIKHLNQNVLVDFPVPLPIKQEQQKIGTFFQQLDHLIALHQRKLEKLQELKKGYLQKMFC